MSAELESVVVVGAGLSGLRTVESLRRRGFAGRLTLLGAEAHGPYDRPPLSKQVLRGELDQTTFRTSAELADLGVEVHTGRPAQGLAVRRRTVQTVDEEFAADAVVIATGSHPRRLPGVDGHVLRTVDHAHALRAELREGRPVMVIGAGLIGCEVAASARMLGVTVELVDALPGPMIRVVGPTVAAYIAAIHAEHGVRLTMAATVGRDADGRLSVDGQPRDAGTVLEAVGCLPSTDWLVDSGLPLADGVVCDEVGRAADGVYAVGDVARWRGVRHEHWTAAARQADQVAATLLDQPGPGREPAYWWSDQYDLKIQALGQPGPDDDVELITWGPKQRTVAVCSRAGALTAVIGFSAPGAVLRLRNEVASGAPVRPILESLRG